MLPIPIGLLSKYLKDFIDGAITRSCYVCCFTSIAKEFENEKVNLKEERKTVGERAKVASDRGYDMPDNFKIWEKKVDTLDQEDTKTDPKCLFEFCPNCIWRYRRGKQLVKKMKEIKKLIETGKELSFDKLPSPLSGVERYSSEYYISFESRESGLLEFLKDDRNYIIGLHGMAGIGKTKLAREVGKALLKSKHFTAVIDTRVSSTPNKKKIQDDIFRSLRLDFGKGCNESDRSKKLWKRLTNGDKILLILDDVWGKINFEDIGIPTSDEHKGCQVLITTRDSSVCKANGCRRTTIQLKNLDENDAWIMFKGYASISDDKSGSFLSTAHKVSEECKRLPLAISLIGARLRDEDDEEEWDEALESLRKPMSVHHVDDSLLDIYNCLKFSYDNMKSEEAKRLFLLCSVFREDDKIPIEVLTRLAIGVGLFQKDYNSYKDARRIVTREIKKLIDSCLLETNEKGIVEMQDLVRKLAQLIANKEIHAVNLSNKNQMSPIEREKNIKYLFCERNLTDVFSCRFDSKLQILIVKVLMDTGDTVLDIPSSFFDNIAGLRVLHLSLSCQDEPTLSSLQPILLLENIRYLLFDWVDLGDISILGDLQNLETLELQWCKVDEFPQQIAARNKLKLLKLEFCKFRRSNPFEVIKSFSSLEELYFLDSFNELCREITLPTLQRYHVRKEITQISDSHSKCVAFEGDGGKYFFEEATFKYLMQTANVLQLSQIGGQWKNVMPYIVPFDKGMNDLVEFHWEDDSQLQCLIDTTNISQLQTVFSKLVVLHLFEINNLEMLCNGSLSLYSLTSLEDLTIECCEKLQSLFNCELKLRKLKTMLVQQCPMLESLFQLSTAQHLVLLEEIIISHCEKLKNIVACDQRLEEGSGEEIVAVDSSMFPVLQVFDIQRCPLLEFIFPFFSAKELLVQGTINISFCANLKYIFGQYQDVDTGSLKQPQLKGPPCFISIFPEGSTSKDGSKAQKELDPVKCKCFSWSRICCYGRKSRSTSTEIPQASDDQLLNISIPLSMKETEDHHISEGSTSGNTVTTIFPNNSQTRIEPPISIVPTIQKDKIRVGGGTSTTHSEFRLKEIVDQNIQEGSTSKSKKTAAATLPTISETTKNEPPIQLIDLKQKGIVISVEEGTTSTNAKTTTSSTHSQLCLKETEDQSIQEGSTSQKTVTATLPTISETMHEPPLQLVASRQKGEEGTKSANAKTLTSSTNLESASSSSGPLATSKSIITSRENGDDQIAIPYLPIATTESLTTQDNDEGNLSQIVEDSSSPSVITRELEQLVSKNYLTTQNLSLLTDFLEKHPSVLPRDLSQNNIYKGYAYKCLADLLKFLQTHSALDVLGSSNSEFVELLQGAHEFGFDKDWLVSVEKRALSPDLQFSQNELQEILDSKQHVTKEVQDMVLKINILSQHVDDLKRQLTSSQTNLESIIQHESQVLKTKAALSVPLGY